jgi:hypothetical protein
VQAPPGHQNEIDQMIHMGGEALVATISQRVESVDEVCLFPCSFFGGRGILNGKVLMRDDMIDEASS